MIQFVSNIFSSHTQHYLITSDFFSHIATSVRRKRSILISVIKCHKLPKSKKKKKNIGGQYIFHSNLPEKNTIRYHDICYKIGNITLQITTTKNMSVEYCILCQIKYSKNINPKFNSIKQFPKFFFTNVGYYSLIVHLLLIQIY